MSSIPPEEVEYQEARFHEDESRSLAAFFTVCLGVTFFCMVSRTTSRLLTSVGLRADDWTFLVGAVGDRNPSRNLIVLTCAFLADRLRLVCCSNDIWSV